MEDTVASLVASRLSDVQFAVVLHGMMAEVGQGPDHITSTLLSYGYTMSTATVRVILRELLALGVVDYGYLMDDDGLLRGKGYWLDTFGMRVRDVLERKATAP